jgi:hypothetical protein
MPAIDEMLTMPAAVPAARASRANECERTKEIDGEDDPPSGVEASMGSNAAVSGVVDDHVEPIVTGKCRGNRG